MRRLPVLAPDRARLLALAVLVIGVALLWLPSIHNEILVGPRSHDYPMHIGLARLWYRTGTLTYPHFLFHVLVVLVHVLVPDFNTAGTIVALTTTCGLAVVLYALIYATMNRLGHRPLRLGLALAATFFLLVIGPITVFTWRRHNLYLGYISPTVYHNPMIAIVKPLAILHFWLFVQFIQEPQRYRTRAWQVVFTGLSVFTLLAQPNYMLCLVPALIIFVLFHVYKKLPIDWRFFVLTVILPAVVVLGFQYFRIYYVASAVSNSRVIVAPFAVLAQASTNLLAKFVLSILFPLVVYVLFFKAAQRNSGLNLAWLLFIVGAFQTYFLAETGNRFVQGNFLWSGQIAVFILMVMTVLFLLKQRAARQPVRLLICTFVLALHIISGLLFYAVAATLPGWNWW
jgi:hypothetical protein